LLRAWDMEQPLVGILMATYNGEKYIADQIESIVEQTYKNWILIIHDDGSNDKTIDIVKEYKNKNHKNIILIEDGIRCGGAKENFSHLLKIAHDRYGFDYIMFSDQDDIWFPYKVKKTLDKMIDIEDKNPNKPVCVYTDLMVVDENLTTISNSFWDYQKIYQYHNTLNRLLIQNVVTGCTIMLNKIAVKLVYEIPHEAVVHDWWIALVLSIFGVLSPMDEATLLYRQHRYNAVGAKKWDMHNGIIRLFSKDEWLRFKKNFKDSSIQAKALLNTYGYLMSKNQMLLVEHYLNLLQYNKPRRLYYVIKYRYFKSNFLRNVGSIFFRILVA